MNSDDSSSLSKSKSKTWETVVQCILCALMFGCVVFIVVVILGKFVPDCNARVPIPKQTPAWNGSDYQSNSEYYQQLTGTHEFNQLDNLRLDRLSSPRFHPYHGKSVIYLRTQYHMPDLIGSSTTLHWIDLETNKTVQLTRPIWNIHDQSFYWIDNKTILFLSNRASSGLTQLFQLNLPDDISMTSNFLGSIQITDYPLSIDNLLVNRQGTRLAFSCQVYANLSIQQTADRQKKEKANSNLMYKFDKLLIRVWDEYTVGPRHHPFIVSIDRNTTGIFYFTSLPTDILFGIDVDSPVRNLRDGKTHWSFSASGNKFAYTRQHEEKSAAAWSTNYDIYTVDLTASKLVSVCITCENLAADGDPTYSPIDEHVLVYRSQPISGYASDQVKIKWYNGSDTKRTLLDNWDRSINAITWSLDGQSLFLELGEEARDVIYKFSNILASSSVPIRLISSGSSHDVNIHPTNNEIFLFTHESLTQPKNIYLYKSLTSIRSITVHNRNLLNKVRMSPVVETFNFTGAEGHIVWGWHVQPVNGTAKKAPLAFLIHGGPQSSWYDTWDYIYNFQVFSSQGYAVIAINFHGSDSYGRNFTNSIIGQYGTLPYEDLQIGLTEILKRYNYIDENRVVALGNSYGGYMVNWIAGHPEMSRRFRTLISDAGIFDLRSFAYSLDYIGVIEHAVGGFAPYEKPETYEKFNPINHVANWSQPMLIIHGGRDYRVPDTQGISAFTALQRRGIPGRMLYFPKEGHGTSNPLNSLDWHQEVFDWMNKWIA